MSSSDEQPVTSVAASTAAGGPPSGARWKLVGPGIVVAATGVGAGDLVATLLAGSRFGYTLLWAVVVGTVIKIALAEAVGRWFLATGQTIFHGWRSLGSWTTVYFAIYVVLWGFLYGATAMTSAALPLAVLFPALDLKVWAMLCGVVGLALVIVGRYDIFEKMMTVLVGIMFVTVVGVALLTTPDVGAALAGLAPVLPEGSLVYTLGLVGGVGGTITMAAYGYWIQAKGWSGPAWIPIMRMDNRVAYVVTGIFVVAMLAVGAELLYAAGIALEGGDRGLLDVGEVLEDQYGRGISILFLVGFFATSFSSLLGVWNGVSLMFADFVANLRGRVDEPDEKREHSPAFRAYILWLTFPPMVLLFLDRPFALVIAYGALGAFFMPFLALTLLWLLNSRRVPAAHRNGKVSNGVLVAALLLFAALCGNELVNLT